MMKQKKGWHRDENKIHKDELIACGGNIAIYDVRIWDSDTLTPLLEKYFGSASVKEAPNVPADRPWECHDETGPVTEHLIADRTAERRSAGNFSPAAGQGYRSLGTMA